MQLLCDDFWHGGEGMHEVDDAKRVYLGREYEAIPSLEGRGQIVKVRVDVGRVDNLLEVDLLLQELNVEGQRFLQVLSEFLPTG